MAINKKELYLMQIRNNPEAIKDLPQEEDLCIAAVKEDGMLLKYIKKQTPKICKFAYLQNKKSLQYATCVFSKKL